MKTIENYLNDLKNKLGSDYAIAKAIGITKQSVSIIRKGGGIKDETAIKIAELLEVDENEVLLAAVIERCKEENTKKVWENISRLLGVAASFLLLIQSVSTLPGFFHGAYCILC